MNSIILTKTYGELPLNKAEIFRYAGAKELDGSLSALLEDCLKEAEGLIDYRVCYRELTVTVKGGVCDFGIFKTESQKLAKNLSGCQKAVLFAATLGVGIDRLITKYSTLSPAKALIFQAIGAERIEALCDTFCQDLILEGGLTLKPRFSPGYGDLSLDTQKEIFKLLDCSRKIGLTLNGSLLMSPTKSVTAFVGVI